MVPRWPLPKISPFLPKIGLRLGKVRSKIPKYQELAAKSLSDALSYWSNPECLPLLSSLFFNLQVKCADLVFDSGSSSFKPSTKLPHKTVRQAQNSVRKMFKLWKLDGKPTSNNTPSKCNYANARANLQRIIRKQRNFFHIRQHNHLKFLDKKNRSKIFSAVRRFRCDPLNTTTPVLHTPVGNFHGGDVLEGFASDAEQIQ